MARRCWIVVVVALLISAVMPTPARTQTGQDTTGANELQVWNVSLRLVRGDSYPSTLDWRQAFRAMATYPYRPDIISVLEAPWPKRDAVMRTITSTLGSSWEYAHVDARTPVCRGSLRDKERVDRCGSTMIVWATDRIDGTCDGCAIKRWPSFEENSAGNCSIAGRNNDQIAARLFDQDQKKFVTQVALHIGAGEPTTCLALSLKDMNDRLERDTRWRDRPLTVVTGDFNEHPQPHTHADPTPGDWRREEAPACWYQRFSLHRGGSDDCTSDPSGVDWSFPYHDVAWVTNSSTPDDICDQWTFGNDVPSSDADKRRFFDTCESKRGRIDYIWLRFEKATNGRAIVVTDDPATPEDEAKRWSNWHIADGGVDRGYYDPTPQSPFSGDESKPYSDHRALQVRVIWCSAEAMSAGYETPCSP